MGMFVWEGEYVRGMSRVCPRTWDLGVGTHPHPLDMGYSGIRSASGRYESYWNAFLLNIAATQEYTLRILEKGDELKISYCNN